MQQGTALAHHALGDFHLFGELGVEGRELDAVRQFGGVERVALFQAQPRQQLLGQDDAGGIADGGDLEFHDGSS